jgi:molybdopterin molybdotransferase
MIDAATETGLLGFADALRLVLDHAGRLPAPAPEDLPLLESLGRTLAEGIATDRDQPPFDRSTRDGFALRAREWTAGQTLTVAGQVRAGELWTGDPLQPGSAIEIMTGAPVPPGADAVVMVEHIARADNRISPATARDLHPGDNIVPRGSEARLGEALLPAGATIGAAEIALAAACGHNHLSVHKRPIVAIVATGDELVEPDQAPAPHQIRNSNSCALAAMVAAAGAKPLRLPIARDTRDAIFDRIAQARAADLLLLSGGVSAGKYDLVEDVLAGLQADFLFTGVRMQPGKPLVFGRLPARQNLPGAGPARYFFGLPGNPVSTQVTFLCFVQPLLRALCGAPVTGPAFVQATLAEDVRGKAGLTRLLPARWTADVERPEVRLVSWHGSGDLAANARANCYAVLPDGRESKAGDVITVLLR